MFGPLPQAKEARKVREQQISKAQMDAARSGGVSWGFGEDAVADEDEDGVGNFSVHVHCPC